MVYSYRIDPTFGGLYPVRFFVCMMSWIGLTVSYIMRFCIGMVITEMVKPIQGKVDPDACPGDDALPNMSSNATLDMSNLKDWDEETQGLILSSFFWGYVVTMIPAGIVADRIGPRRVLVISALFTSLFTILTPVMAHSSDYIGIIVVRILLGLAQACFYAGLHTVVAIWVPTQERGVWGTLVFSGAHFGNAISNLFSAIMLDVFRPHWENVFYIWGSIGFVWGVLFFFTTYDNYKQLPSITDKERDVLDAYYEKVNKKSRVIRTPWKEIWTSFPVWAIIIGMIGHDWGLFALVTDIPKYMKSVLRFNVKKNGSYVALGYLSLCAVACLCGLLVDLIDRKKWMSKTWNRILFTTIASVGPSLGLLATNYAHCNRTLAVVFLVLGMCTVGTFYPSLKVNPIDLSPNHAGTIGAMGHCIGALSGIIVPYFIGIMTPDSTWYQWTVVWWVTFGVMSITNIFYVFTASGEVQEWNTKGLEELPSKDNIVMTTK